MKSWERDFKERQFKANLGFVSQDDKPKSFNTLRIVELSRACVFAAFAVIGEATEDQVIAWIGRKLGKGRYRFSLGAEYSIGEFLEEAVQGSHLVVTDEGGINQPARFILSGKGRRVVKAAKVVANQFSRRVRAAA